MSLRLVVFCFWICALPASVAAQQVFPRKNAPVYVALFDLRSSDTPDVERVDLPAVVGFSLKSISGTTLDCGTLTDDSKGPVEVKALKAYIECALGQSLSGDPLKTAVTFKQRVKAAELIADSFREFRKEHSTRAISTHGDEVIGIGIQIATQRTITRTCEDNNDYKQAFTVIVGRTPQFKIKETERKTRFETDFGVLLQLATKVSGPATFAGSPDVCVPKYSATKPADTTWLTGTPIALSTTRATVALDATLPAAVPSLLESEGLPVEDARKLAAEADKFLATKAREEAEEQDLKLRAPAACPPKNDKRFDPLAYAACGLKEGATEAEQLQAIEALSEMSTPRRASLLRWAVEFRKGQVRDKAFNALMQIESAGAAAPEKGKETKQSTSFTSGPAEHWSIGADVFLTRKTHSPFKTSDDGLVLNGTPPVFYVSIDFLLGDLLSERRSRAGNVELKWLVKGAKKPFDSLGFGIGYRGNHLKRFGIDFDLLSPFFAWTWSTAEEEGRPRVGEKRFGVSVNLSKALDWVK